MRFAAIAVLLLGPNIAAAQDRSSMSVFAEGPPGELAIDTSITAPANGPALPPPEPAFTPFLQWSLQYSDGLQSAPGKPTETYLRSYSAGFDLTRAHWALNYAHTLSAYSSSSFADNQGDQFRFDGKWAHDVWRAGASQTYSSTNQPNTETATQIRAKTVGTAFQAARLFGSRLIASTAVTQRLSFMDRANDTKDWQFDSTLQYNVSQATSLGLVLGGGYTQIANSPDATVLRPGLSFDWVPSQKISATLNVAAEQLHFSSSARGTISSFTYSSSLKYRPFQTTSISIQGLRQLTPSFFSNNYLKSDGWNVGLQQRLLGHLNFGATFSESWTRYVVSRLIITPSVEASDVLDDEGRVIGLRIRTLFDASTVFFNRTDVQRSINLSLGVAWLKNGVASLIYRHSRNSTNAAGFSYGSKLIGFEVGWHF